MRILENPYKKKNVFGYGIQILAMKGYEWFMQPENRETIKQEIKELAVQVEEGLTHKYYKKIADTRKVLMAENRDIASFFDNTYTLFFEDGYGYKRPPEIAMISPATYPEDYDFQESYMTVMIQEVEEDRYKVYMVVKEYDANGNLKHAIEIGEYDVNNKSLIYSRDFSPFIEDAFSLSTIKDPFSAYNTINDMNGGNYNFATEISPDDAYLHSIFEEKWVKQYGTKVIFYDAPYKGGNEIDKKNAFELRAPSAPSTPSATTAPPSTPSTTTSSASTPKPSQKKPSGAKGAKTFDTQAIIRLIKAASIHTAYLIKQGKSPNSMLNTLQNSIESMEYDNAAILKMAEEIEKASKEVGEDKLFEICITNISTAEVPNSTEIDIVHNKKIVEKHYVSGEFLVAAHVAYEGSKAFYYGIGTPKEVISRDIAEKIPAGYAILNFTVTEKGKCAVANTQQPETATAQSQTPTPTPPKKTKKTKKKKKAAVAPFSIEVEDPLEVERSYKLLPESIQNLSYREAQIAINGERLRALYEEMTQYYKFKEELDADIYASTILTKNGSILLKGVPATGKTTLITITTFLFMNPFKKESHIEFGNIVDAMQKTILGVATHNYDKKPAEVLYSTDINVIEKKFETVKQNPALTGGVKWDDNMLKLDKWTKYDIAPKPRAIISHPIKFHNEANRMKPDVQDAVLSLIEENRVEYMGHFLKSPKESMHFFDYNPHLEKQKPLDWAFLDRINVGIYLPIMDFEARYSIVSATTQKGQRVEERVLEDWSNGMFQPLTFTELVHIQKWIEKNIEITEEEYAMASAVQSFFELSLRQYRENYHRDLEKEWGIDKKKEPETYKAIELITRYLDLSKNAFGASAREGEPIDSLDTGNDNDWGYILHETIRPAGYRALRSLIKLYRAYKFHMRYIMRDEDWQGEPDSKKIYETMVNMLPYVIEHRVTVTGVSSKLYKYYLNYGDAIKYGLKPLFFDKYADDIIGDVNRFVEMQQEIQDGKYASIKDVEQAFRKRGNKVLEIGIYNNPLRAKIAEGLLIEFKEWERREELEE